MVLQTLRYFDAQSWLSLFITLSGLTRLPLKTRKTLNYRLMSTNTKQPIEQAESGNLVKPVLTAVAISECLEILSSQMNVSLHFSKYPQDRFKDELEQKEIKVLISTSEYHNKRWQDIKSVIDHLIAVSQNCG